MAKNCFENIKKRYLKRRNELKKWDKSGTSSAVVDKARRDLDVYSFLFWIDYFLKPRKTKCNIPNDIPSSILEGNEESSDEECLVEQFIETEEEEVPIKKKTTEPKTIKTKK